MDNSSALKLAGIQITTARLTLSLSAWGKLGLVNLYGNIEGYVNVDVHCKDGCRTWDIHNQLNLAAYGHVTMGPNLYGTAIGLRAGFWGHSVRMSRSMGRRRSGTSTRCSIRSRGGCAIGESFDGRRSDGNLSIWAQ